VVVLLAFAQLSPGPVLASHSEDDLEQARERLKDLRGEFRAAEARLKQVRAAIVSLTNQISEATAQLEALDFARQETGSAIRHSEAKTEELQSRLDARARDVYISGPAGVLELILEAESLADLADRFSFLDALSRGDASVVDGLVVQRRELVGLRTTLAEYEEEYESLLAGLEGKGERLNVKFAAQEAVIAELDDKVAEAERAVEDLEKEAQQELLAQYGIVGGGTAGPPVSADGPLYWCPVDPPRSYVDTFGAPRPDGRTHQGNDVFAPEGTPIRATFAGMAEEGSNGLGGYTVNVHADNGDYSYNAHMSGYADVDGQRVEPGDVIGFVGNTGNRRRHTAPRPLRVPPRRGLGRQPLPVPQRGVWRERRWVVASRGPGSHQTPESPDSPLQGLRPSPGPPRGRDDRLLRSGTARGDRQPLQRRPAAAYPVGQSTSASGAVPPW
jgi:peptidoglycan hydrolase CwlO-like protein